ncbi:DUF1566 domain-containing protein [Undibacterium sp. FT147W]|uniref:DUF1566 domain-containing protein n=1 Tax=Undibacterium rivi TaxID=2828729 RepID=A0ABS5H0Y3_9BURK|nr:DUF1566 domain-containing protein [Undibacterium rivi]MBR7792337.1 DUF1566 domain-containing protein [Undibacterium rivi]
MTIAQMTATPAATAASAISTLLTTIAIPRIDTFLAEHGGIFAGIVAGENDAPDYFLIHATSDHELFDIDWHNSVEAAQAPINGLTDWSLPTRREARLLAINCRDSFDLDSLYWTSEQNALIVGYAWMQSFLYGGQGYNHKSFKYRARAVRRVFIIQ